MKIATHTCPYSLCFVVEKQYRYGGGIDAVWRVPRKHGPVVSRCVPAGWRNAARGCSKTMRHWKRRRFIHSLRCKAARSTT